MNTPAQVTKEHRALWNKLYNLAFNECFMGDSSDAQATQLIADSEAKATAQANAQVESLLLSAKNAIPASEHPAEPTVENWAWQIRNLGDDRRLVYTERDQLRAELARLDTEKPWLKEANATVAELRAEVEREREWQAGVLVNAKLHHAERKEALAQAESAEREVERLRRAYVRTDDIRAQLESAIARAERAEAELANIRALADRRNKRYHVEDTTHQLVAALDQALDIAQAELAAANAKLLRNESDGYLCELERTRAELVATLSVCSTETYRAEEAEHDCRVLIVQLNVAKDERATERARLDWLEDHGWITGEPCDRAAIDAAMKEEAK